MLLGEEESEIEPEPPRYAWYNVHYLLTHFSSGSLSEADPAEAITNSPNLSSPSPSPTHDGSPHKTNSLFSQGGGDSLGVK